MVTNDATDSLQKSQLSFKNNFWNGEIGNFQGFEVLVKRLKDDRSMCKDYLEFLRQRCLIEEQYGKALIKLAKSTNSKDEMSCVRGAWDSIRNHTENIGLNHVQASSQMSSEMSKVTEFLETSRDKRRWAEDSVRGLQTQLRAAHKRLGEVKKCYETKCKEEIQANHQYHQEVSRAGRDTTVADRAHNKHVKSMAGVEQSEEIYRHAVECMEETRSAWLQETETCVQIFQDIVTSRLRVLRENAWVCSNISSAVCVSDDRLLEDTRLCLETSFSDIDLILKSWIASHQTSNERPGVVSCEIAPTSSTIGMGHMATQKQLSYDTASLGRVDSATANKIDTSQIQSPSVISSQSCSHLTEVGRSRSDLGYIRPPAPQAPVMMSPKKPPRMYQYNNNSLTSHRRSVAEANKPAKPPSNNNLSVENAEYFGLSSSDYHSDTCESSPRGRSVSRGGHEAPSPQYEAKPAHDIRSPMHVSNEISSRGRSVSRVGHEVNSAFPMHQARDDIIPRHASVDRYTDRLRREKQRQAMVLNDYKRKHYTEISLVKNTVVRILDGKPQSDWWRVETEQGLSGYYPSSYLRHI